MPDFKKKYKKYKKKYRDLVDKLNHQNNIPLRNISPINIVPLTDNFQRVRVLPSPVRLVPSPVRLVQSPLAPFILSPFVNRKYGIAALFEDNILSKIINVTSALKNKYNLGVISSNSNIKLALGFLKSGSEESLRKYFYGFKDIKPLGIFKNLEITTTLNKIMVNMLVESPVLSDISNYLNEVISNEINEDKKLYINLLSLRLNIVPSLEEVKTILNFYGLPEGTTFQIKDFQINKI